MQKSITKAYKSMLPQVSFTAANRAPITLPSDGLPLHVEIELTNICNARCVACPRSNMPSAGIMSQDTLRCIINRYKQRSDSALTRVSVAGGGEPLLHRDAPQRLAELVAEGFQTTLITNASALSRSRAKRIAEVGLHHVSVSVWGIEPDEYERSMGLPFERTLANVLHMAELCAKSGTVLSVDWVRVATLRNSDEEIRAFWLAHGVETDGSDSAVWNRGGRIGSENTTLAHLPDPNRAIWCADLYFSDAYNWKGDLLPCCCQYFTHWSIGNVLTDGEATLSRRKGQLLRRRPLPAMCQVCRLPRRKRGAWLAEPILHHLSQQDLAMILEYPDDPLT